MDPKSNKKTLVLQYRFKRCIKNNNGFTVSVRKIIKNNFSFIDRATEIIQKTTLVYRSGNRNR